MAIRSLECCIPSKNPAVCTCQVDKVMSVVSKKWALLIVRSIASSGKAGYNDLLKVLGAISPSTLAQRLKQLEKAGVLSRKIVGDAPIRVEYALTNEGQEFIKAITPITNWASQRRARH